MKKARSGRHIVETTTDADYASDLALLANIIAQAESDFHTLEEAASDIVLNVNVNKTEAMYFKQKDAITSLSGNLLKSMNQFTYLGNNFHINRK